MVPKTPFAGRMLMVGFGSVGRGTLPLLLRHIDLEPAQLSIIAADTDGAEVAREYGVRLDGVPLTPANFALELGRRLRAGDFLVNASVNVSSMDLIAWCLAYGVHYIDASLEPWNGAQADDRVPAAQRSNYAYREQALALRQGHASAATCVLTHGANPGLVSHLVKRALEQLASEAGIALSARPEREEWAALAQRLGVRVIHVAERDGQQAAEPKRCGEFLSTWSCAAFAYESLQPAELGWGTHERGWPPDGRRFDFGSGAAIYLERAGLAVRMRSWVPHHGAYHGWLISHAEAISLADYLSVRHDGAVVYRPTCHYVYRPCDAAALSLMELHERDGRLQERTRLLRDEITGGIDELGVLLMGPAGGACWYGSQLAIGEARSLAPHNTATTLQVNASLVAGIAWAILNPRRGVVEPEDMDHRFVLDFTLPYLGRVIAARTDWTPLDGRASLGAEPPDPSDPWQFANFRVT